MSINLVDGPVVLAGATDGVAIVPSPDPLTRLNFFDGRLLRGEDLTVEQDGERRLDLLVASASGSGVAWGLDVDRNGETLTVSAGLAFDPQGRPLLLPSDVVLAIADLLGADAVAPATGDTRGTSAFAPCVLGLPVEVTVDPVSAWTAYLLTIGWVEGLCGTMDVYGAACDQACVGTTNRPYRVDGVVFRMRPLSLRSPLPVSKSVALTATHLRSRLAAAYFADERAAGPVPSAASLSSSAWCRGGVEPGGAEVPLAMVVRFGRATGFHDEWVARRERLEPPARSGFDLRLAVRPRAVWDAQLGQFQCQLADRISTGGLPSGTSRLVTGGFVELPPCGFLPIDQNADVVAQVTAMMGPGVDLRFVPVPEDVVAHELETVQHRDRISLLTGLDDPAARPLVDILVPGGGPGTTSATDELFRLEVSLAPGGAGDPMVFDGVSRLAPRGTGFTLSGAGMAGVTSAAGARDFIASLGPRIVGSAAGIHRVAGSGAPVSLDALRAVATDMRTFTNRTQADQRTARPFARFARAEAKPIAGRAVLVVDRDVWELGSGDAAFVHLTADTLTPVEDSQSTSVDVVGQLTSVADTSLGASSRRLRFTGQVAVTGRDGNVSQSTVDLEATVARTPGGGDGPDHYQVVGVENVLQELIVGGSPVQLSGTGADRRDRATLVADSGVADPNSPSRKLADMALQLLQGARPTDPQFLERARMSAFGQVRQEPVAVSAGTDWVAFRRRPPEPPVLPTPPRTVSLWVTTADTLDIARRSEKILIAGDGDRLTWKQVATASIDATTGALLTPAGDLQNGYQDTGAGSAIAFVGWAPANMSSGSARSSALAAALDPVATLDAGAPIRALSTPPSAQMDPDTDGSVFLIAYTPARSQDLLQVLAAVTPPQANTEVLARMAKQPDRALLEDAMSKEIFRTIGTVPFLADQPDSSAVDTVGNDAVGLLAALRPFDTYPVLWVDRDWSAANQPLLDAVQRTAEDLAGRVDQAQGVQRTVRVLPGAIGTDPTPCVLLDTAFAPQ